ncbi:hypothetical protein A5634_18125 [Mycobacterium asiaticum]|uniref:PKD domain-containing protein n=1 Tax=Mycobacterium asiaticum TaxID=1790 RepID=A0A1A3P784_MYCAS|nr:hypothetical protein [Mycobacterium asiaticum]OBK29525.1 hypothetical protein A5634_18125 [Mycobacterium asiaticum]
MMANTNTADVTPLDETREEKAASRQRHPAGNAAPVATASAGAVKKAAAPVKTGDPAKKATPKAAAATPKADKPAATDQPAGKPVKLRWQFGDGGYAEREVEGQQAYSAGHAYAILPVEDQEGKFSAVVKADDGEPQYLVEVGAHSKCYQACVAHHRGLTAQARPA